jgi:DNA-binding NarL/FixJ family response regulator
VVLASANVFGVPLADVERLILKESPESKVFFLSTNEQANSANGDSPQDLSGPAALNTSIEELVDKIRSTRKTKMFDVRSMPHRGRGVWKASHGFVPRNRDLTMREREVLKLLAEGKTVRSAAEMLGLSVKTVDAHKFNLMRKLGVHNKAELVMCAIRRNIVKIPANF